MRRLDFQSKLVDSPQSLEVGNGVTTFIGGNGSGKSSILEAIFKKYLDDDDLRVVCFSSGQNELFSDLFNAHKKTNRRYIRERNEPIQSFYFDSKWIRLLIFWSSIFIEDGLVRKYLVQNNYIIEDDLGDDASSRLEFKFRIKKHYANLIKEEVSEEELGMVREDEEGYSFQDSLLRQTDFHETLEKIIDVFHLDFDFQNNDNLVKRKLTFTSSKAFRVFTHKNIDKIFSFWALATNGWLSNSELSEFNLYFKDNLEFKNLSDGEYQMLSTYAIIDLFDSEDSIFLFDEIDSHLYYQNIQKMWNVLKNCQGLIITTTHISDSILQNEIDNIKLIENGKIEQDLTFTELSKRLTDIVGQKKYQFDILSRVKYPVLMDNINDWTIFKKLAIKKLGEDVEETLEKFLPISKESGYSGRHQKFGHGKLKFIDDFRIANTGKEILTEHIFLICDKDELPVTDIEDNLVVNIDREFQAVKKFNSNRTKTHLLSWKRREIENYFLCPTLLTQKGCMEAINNLYQLPNLEIGDNLDRITDIKEGDFKTVMRPLYNVEHIGFTEELVDEMVSIIPSAEISEDIELLYNYLNTTIN